MREPTKKIEKEQPERERRKPGECDGLEAKQKKQVKEEQVHRVQNWPLNLAKKSLVTWARTVSWSLIESVQRSGDYAYRWLFCGILWGIGGDLKILEQWGQGVGKFGGEGSQLEPTELKAELLETKPYDLVSKGFVIQYLWSLDFIRE